MPSFEAEAFEALHGILLWLGRTVSLLLMEKWLALKWHSEVGGKRVMYIDVAYMYEFSE